MGDIYAAENGFNAEDMARHKAIADFWKRSNQQPRTKEFLATNSDLLGLKNAKSMASVGPAIGEIDSYLIKVCAPNISEYYGVEPSDCHAAHLRRRLEANNPGVKKINIVQQFGQDWAGPSSPVDVILLFHVLYYIPQQMMKDFVARCRRWLTDNGTILIAINKETDFMRDLAKLHETNNDSGDIRDVLRELRYPFEEHDVDTSIDLSEPLDEFAELVYDRKPSPEEVDLLGSFCEKHKKISGSDRVEMPVTLFVLRKNSGTAWTNNAM